jgi:hypothetical protein
MEFMRLERRQFEVRRHLRCSTFLGRPWNCRRILGSPLVVVLFCLLISPEVLRSSTGDQATITFRKIFKSSYPEFVEIKVNEAGSGTYDIRQLDEDANAQPFQIGAPIAQRIFELAGRLRNFRGVDLNVPRRVANLGQKTFRYEKAGQVYEVTFNYTLDESATQLLVMFEGIAREEGDLSDLLRTMRYDRLGVNDVLLVIEGDYDNKLFPEPRRLLPALDQLAADDKFIDIARQRARTLATRIRAAP